MVLDKPLAEVPLWKVALVIAVAVVLVGLVLDALAFVTFAFFLALLSSGNDPALWSGMAAGVVILIASIVALARRSGGADRDDDEHADRSPDTASSEQAPAEKPGPDPLVWLTRCGLASKDGSGWRCVEAVAHRGLHKFGGLDELAKRLEAEDSA